MTKYDAEFFEGVDDIFGMSGAGTRRQRDADRRRLAQFIQDDAVLQQIQVGIALTHTRARAHFGH